MIIARYEFVIIAELSRKAIELRDQIQMMWKLSLSHRNTNFTIERGQALFVEWTVLVSIISPESFIISPRADYETHNQP